MHDFVAMVTIVTAFGASFSILGVLLTTAPLAWSFGPKERAWFLRRGDGRQRVREGHERGFTILQALGEAPSPIVEMLKAHARAGERARAWIYRFTWPWIVTGMITVLIASVTTAVASNLPEANSSWFPFYVGLYCFATFAFVFPISWNALLSKQLIPREFSGALLLGDALRSLTAPAEARPFLGSEITRLLRPLERAARRSLTWLHGDAEKLPNTRNVRAVAKATSELSRFVSGAGAVDRDRAISVAWLLSSVWRDDSSPRRWGAAAEVRWLPRSRFPRALVVAASPVGIIVLTALVDIAISLLTS